MRALVFVLRGCPVGWLGAYGNEWVVTPNLDRFAAEGVVFDRHLSDCPDPDAATLAWLSGRHQIPPFSRDAESAERSAGGSALVSAESADSASRLNGTLHAAGVRTVLVRANHPDTDASPPYYAAWGEVFDARPQPDDSSPLDH